MAPRGRRYKRPRDLETDDIDDFVAGATREKRASRACPTTWDEFWPYYVSQHLHPVNRWLHFVGTSAALGCLAASPLVPPLLAAAPVVGYGLAWIGHFAIEKNKPATFGNPLWSLRGDFKMWSLMLRGKMDAEIAAHGQYSAMDASAEAA